MTTTRSWLRCLSIEIPSDESISSDGDYCCSSRGVQQHLLLNAARIEAESNNNFVADIRMPDISSARPSSPAGGTKRDISNEDHHDHIKSDKATMPMTTTIQRKVCSQRIPPKVPPPPFLQYGNLNTAPTTVIDAYNNGTLFSHFTSLPSSLSCCWTDTTASVTNEADKYEKNWSGHQPLMPRTWLLKEPSSISDMPERGSKDRMLSTSEIRYRRRRRRRGIWSPRNNESVLRRYKDDDEFFESRVGASNGNDCQTSESKT
jgi:hypothetical protein